MLLLKVIARLLDYPTQELLDNSPALIEATQSSGEIPPVLRQQTIRFIKTQATTDLYDLQAQYDGLFERGRYLCLLLFEHVHGESRDRGQAMVDLLDTYRAKGFELASHQMPDYLPLFLEFLSEQEDLYAREWLADVSHILALLEGRLEQRGAGHSGLFSNLLVISGAKVNKDIIKTALKKEQPDTSMDAIDKAWEDKEIRFDDPIDSASCSSQSKANQHTSSDAVPLVWKHKAQNQYK